MLKQSFTAVCFSCALILPATLNAEESNPAQDKESQPAEQTTSQIENPKSTVGSKLLNGIKSLFSLNSDEDEAALLKAQESSNALFQEIQSLKSDAIELNAELQLLEQELLFPVNTQVTVFVSLETEELFQLESVRLTMDNQLVQSHLYEDAEVQALIRGGMQRLHISNMGNGPHELTAVFTGIGPNGRDYERAISKTFIKKSGAQYLQLHINDQKAKNQPEFQIITW